MRLSKHCPMTCWPRSRRSHSGRSPALRDHLAHRYFDTAHAILQATVDEDLPDLERAVQALTRSVEKEDPDTRTGAT